jgi:hypothetical protein
MGTAGQVAMVMAGQVVIMETAVGQYTVALYCNKLDSKKARNCGLF